MPEIHCLNVIAMMARVCPDKYDGTVGISEKLGTTTKYKENCYERKVRRLENLG